ncbi:MAG: hypothetical protein DMF54_01055 [Acidobacteria bacterium]|nr:MAG: hypothetical protein DMF55_00635 [Acidobacteriota bacterium]PYQ68334.1 MAG: hypothetical protein DMF54_01055 [Acidobacteriota bacterium]
MKPSPDRVLYLSRIIAKKLKDNLNLVQKADDETVRRAIVRDLTEAYKELDAMEEKVRTALAKRKNVSRRDEEFLFVRNLDDELRKHGA